MLHSKWWQEGFELNELARGQGHGFVLGLGGCLQRLEIWSTNRAPLIYNCLQPHGLSSSSNASNPSLNPTTRKHCMSTDDPCHHHCLKLLHLHWQLEPFTKPLHYLLHERCRKKKKRRWRLNTCSSDTHVFFSNLHLTIFPPPPPSNDNLNEILSRSEQE